MKNYLVQLGWTNIPANDSHGEICIPNIIADLMAETREAAEMAMREMTDNDPDAFLCEIVEEIEAGESVDNLIESIYVDRKTIARRN